MEIPRSKSGPPARWSTAMRATIVTLLHGSSLQFGLCCPKPSTLNRPDPPHSRAHRNFTSSAYMRCLRGAGAPRRPASGSGLLPIDPSQHVILYVPGEPPAADFQFLRGARLPWPGSYRLGTPDVSEFGAYGFTIATTC